MKTKLLVISTVTASLLASQVLAAAGAACLQHNRMQSWRAIDETTMVMTDMLMNRYTVRLKNRCSNIARPAAVITSRTWQNLSCLQPGEIIMVTAPGMGSVTCSVASVEGGAPNAPPAG